MMEVAVGYAEELVVVAVVVVVAAAAAVAATAEMKLCPHGMSLVHRFDGRRKR